MDKFESEFNPTPEKFSPNQEFGEGAADFIERAASQSVSRSFDIAANEKKNFYSQTRIYDDPGLKEQEEQPLRTIEDYFCKAGFLEACYTKLSGKNLIAEENRVEIEKAFKSQLLRDKNNWLKDTSHDLPSPVAWNVADYYLFMGQKDWDEQTNNLVEKTLKSEVVNELAQNNRRNLEAAEAASRYVLLSGKNDFLPEELTIMLTALKERFNQSREAENQDPIFPPAAENALRFAAFYSILKKKEA